MDMLQSTREHNTYELWSDKWGCIKFKIDIKERVNLLNEDLSEDNVLFIPFPRLTPEDCPYPIIGDLWFYEGKKIVKKITAIEATIIKSSLINKQDEPKDYLESYFACKLW